MRVDGGWSLPFPAHTLGRIRRIPGIDAVTQIKDRREAALLRAAAEAREAARLYALQDRWIANEILKLARSVRSRIPPGLDDGYNGYLLWDLVPEIARRLGATLLPNESMDHETRSCGNERLRELASLAVRYVGRHHLRDAARPDLDLCPVSFLTRDAVNGNPVVIALDRVAPPGPAAGDILAHNVSGIAAYRGHPETRAWHPGLQGDPEPGRRAGRA